jgi:4-aminobutyrate aminotransferase
VVDRASGEKVWDVDGNLFLDFSSGVSVLNIGTAIPWWSRRCRTRRPRSSLPGTDYYYDVQSRLVERLAKIAPARARRRFS